MTDAAIPYDLLRRQADEHPYPLLFATISGAHLYGFPSPDSDYDLRGVHLLPLDQVVGLEAVEETVEQSDVRDGLEMDLVTHDAKKFFGLMLKNNGYVLEQLFSPLIVSSSREHEELKAIASSCVTRHHVHHYLGFADRQWKLFCSEDPPRVKPLLYLYRVLLTGIHLMQSGAIEANLLMLNEEARLPYIDELVERKTSGFEKSRLEAADLAFHEQEYLRLRARLEEAGRTTQLADKPAGRAALQALLIRLRRDKPPMRNEGKEAVILIGVQASGKSTFYHKRFHRTHLRINRDMLGTRHREDLLVAACLEGGQSFVIDNTNAMAEVRRRSIETAKAAGFRVVGYYLASALETCKRRNRERSASEAVPEAGLLGTYAKLELPQRSEGFDDLYYVAVEDQGVYQVSEWNDEVQ